MTTCVSAPDVGTMCFRTVDPYLNTQPLAGVQTHGYQRLSTDPIGSMTLTLTNVVVGSRYRIERQGDGSLATPAANAEGTAASGTVVIIILDAFTVGNANNNLRVKVRKGTSAPYYQPWETLMTAAIGSQSIYVAQVADE